MATSIPLGDASISDCKPKARPKNRKRAPRACLSCRGRKVRCDVSHRGFPCTNCQLDNEACVVAERAPRFHKSAHVSSDPLQVSLPRKPLEEQSAVPANSDSVHCVVTSRADDCSEPIAQHIEELPEPIQEPEPQKSPPYPGLRTCVFSSPLNDSQHTRDSHIMGFDIVYTYYPFLKVDTLPNLPPQDVNFLEQQGCLRVPIRRLLDEFVQQYFLHVHPLLPLVQEDEFWELYSPEAESQMSASRVPLLVLQAIMFTSCNFVSRDTITALGYLNIRAAKSSFYRRAKLLYDLDTESSQLALAQAALLLSLWTPLENRNSNTWLSLAIQHAKSAEAHRHAFLPALSSIDYPMRYRRQNHLKKIWWCCVIRDRTLSLLLRRPIQITSAHFDINSCPLLKAIDMEHEFDHSRVYNRETKSTLAEILAKLVELYVALTDVLLLTYPLEDTIDSNHLQKVPGESRIRECKSSMKRWYQSAILQFPSFGENRASRFATDRKAARDSSVILYTNLMYIYYHSSCVTLSHYDILHLAMPQIIPNTGVPSSTTNLSKNLSILHENQHDLRHAVLGVTECLEELVRLDLVRWLPISAVASTALPLLLHILDMKLSGATEQPDENARDQSSIKQHRLHILIQVMHTYEHQYDGVDWVSKIVRHIVSLARLDNSDPTKIGEHSTDWADILSLQPRFYLSLVLALDFGLSKGRLPEETDFPLGLRDLFIDGFNPLKRLIEARRANSIPKCFSCGSTVITSSVSEICKTPSSDFRKLSSPSKTRIPEVDEAGTFALSSQCFLHAATDKSSSTNDSSSADTSVEEKDKPSDNKLEGTYSNAMTTLMSSEWFETVWEETYSMNDREDREVIKILDDTLVEHDEDSMMSLCNV